METNERQRRVGTFTLGVVLVVSGALMLASMFWPQLDWEWALKCSPLILIGLGVETLIALNGIEKVPARIPALLGLGCSLLALALFGPNRFLIPAMILILIALMIYRPFEQRSQQ